MLEKQEMIEELLKKLKKDLQQYLRECRGTSKPIDSPSQRRRDLLMQVRRNYPCPVCIPERGMIPHKITSKPPATSLEEYLTRAESEGHLDEWQGGSAHRAAIADAWSELRTVEERIKELESTWRYSCPTDSMKGIQQQIDLGRYVMNRGPSRYIHTLGKKLIRKKTERNTRQ